MRPRGAALIETGRLTHEELLDGATRTTGTPFEDDLAIPDDFPGRLDGEVVKVELEDITIVHQTEIEVNRRPFSEFDAAHFHAGQVADRGRTDVALSVHPTIGEGVVQPNRHTGVVAARTVVEAGVRIVVAASVSMQPGNAIQFGQGEVEGSGRTIG